MGSLVVDLLVVLLVVLLVRLLVVLLVRLLVVLLVGQLLVDRAAGSRRRAVRLARIGHSASQAGIGRFRRPISGEIASTERPS